MVKIDWMSMSEQKMDREIFRKYLAKLFDELGGHAVSFSTFIGNESLAHLVERKTTHHCL